MYSSRMLMLLLFFFFFFFLIGIPVKSTRSRSTRIYKVRICVAQHFIVVLLYCIEMEIFPRLIFHCFHGFRFIHVALYTIYIQAYILNGCALCIVTLTLCYLLLLFISAIVFYALTQNSTQQSVRPFYELLFAATVDFLFLLAFNACACVCVCCVVCKTHS